MGKREIGDSRPRLPSLGCRRLSVRVWIHHFLNRSAPRALLAHRASPFIFPFVMAETASVCHASPLNTIRLNVISQWQFYLALLIFLSFSSSSLRASNHS